MYNRKKNQEDGTFSGHAWQLGDALKELGYQVPRRLQGLVVVRYGDDQGNISLNDFLMATCRISVMLGEWATLGFYPSTLLDLATKIPKPQRVFFTLTVPKPWQTITIGS